MFYHQERNIDPAVRAAKREKMLAAAQNRIGSGGNGSKPRHKSSQVLQKLERQEKEAAATRKERPRSEWEKQNAEALGSAAFSTQQKA